MGSTAYISTYYAYKANPLESTRYVEPRFYEARDDQDIELMAPLSYSLIHSYYSSGYYFKIKEIIPEVITLLEKTKRESESFGTPMNIYSYICDHYGLSLMHSGNLEEGKSFIKKAHDFAIKMNNLINLGQTELHYGVYYMFKGNGKKVIEHGQKSIKYFEEANFPWFVGMNWATLGYGYWLLGDLNTAQKHIETGSNSQKDIPTSLSISVYPLYLCFVYYTSGDLAKAQSYAEEALVLAIKNGDLHYEGLSRLWLGRILGNLDASKWTEAEEHIIKGMRILEELKLKPNIASGYFYLGELYANTGRKDKAFKNLEMALSMFQEMDMDRGINTVQEVLDRL